MARSASKTEELEPMEQIFKNAARSGSKLGVRTFGYARVSTGDQSVALQIDALVAAGVPRDCIVEETGSGFALGARPRRDALLAELKAGDEIAIWRLDRLGRSLSEIAQITEDLVNRGIKLRSLVDGVDPTTSTGRLLLGILASTAEYERNLISERTAAGLAAARKRGTKLGRPKTLSPRGLDTVLVMTQAGRTAAEIADGLGCSESTVKRARRLLRGEGKLS